MTVRHLRRAHGARHDTDLTPEVVLENGLIAHFGRPLRITRVESEQLAISSHPVSRLRVTLSTGDSIRVIFKRLQPEKMPHRGSVREVLVYRRLLAGRRYGAPALYASLHDPAGGRFWLFLEDVGDWGLEDGESQHWSAAVRWLAEMHGAYTGRDKDLKALDCLGCHGPEYYRWIAHAARQNLVLASNQHAVDRFDRLMEPFDSLVVYLTRQPRTLVHGDVFARQLRLQSGPRVRPLDWESAAIGLGAWDLACLLDGWGPAQSMFLEAYLDELTRHADAPVDRRELAQTFEHCQVINVLRHLRWSREVCRDASFVHALLDAMQSVWDRLGRRADRA